MRWWSRLASVERARPLLGTTVAIRVDGVDVDRANRAIDGAFAEIALVHRLMSFQEPDSEVSAANHAAARVRVGLHDLTSECLRRAIGFARASDGAFDPTAVAGDAARKRPGRWHDIDLDERGVRFARPLCFDLSGIAKGFAVDRACTVLRDAGVAAAVVNAGGDLRVFGDAAERVALRPVAAAAPAMIMLTDGALASSDPAGARAEYGAARHRDGRDRRPVAERFVAVAAPSCADADALTKIVLALDEASAPLLAGFGAVAHLLDAGGWKTIGAAA